MSYIEEFSDGAHKPIRLIFGRCGSVTRQTHFAVLNAAGFHLKKILANNSLLSIFLKISFSCFREIKLALRKKLKVLSAFENFNCRFFNQNEDFENSCQLQNWRASSILYAR